MLYPLVSKITNIKLDYIRIKVNNNMVRNMQNRTWLVVDLFIQTLLNCQASEINDM